MPSNSVYGVTIGDPSGVGPEILLKAEALGEIKQTYIAYGDAAVLRFYNEKLGLGVSIRTVSSPADHTPGCLNVIDHRLLTVSDVKPGKLVARPAPRRVNTWFRPPRQPSPERSPP